MFWGSQYYGALLMPWDKDKPSGKSLAVNGVCSGWCWDPLNDDGDAFRLAVKLGLDIMLNRSSICIELDQWDHWIVEPHNNSDPYKAVRRAIVRAAAELATQHSK